MAKEKNMFGDNPKLSFFLGLFIGVAVFSTITALVLVTAMFSGDGLSFAKSDNQDDVVAANVDEPVAAQPTQEVIDVPPVTSEDNTYGPSDAKVTLIQYSDFECPYCANFSSTIKQIIEEYGDDVQVVFRHFPLSFHANAREAAIASECAAEQGMFWEMHDKIFEANLTDTMSAETWGRAAADLGLDTDDFADCMESDRYDEKIASQMQEGAKAGVKGTPATFVNGTIVSGALPYESFTQIIDSELQ